MKSNNNQQLEIFLSDAKQYLDAYFQCLIGSNEKSLSDIYPITIPKIQLDQEISLEGNASDYLGNLYEQSVPREIRKDFGQFYTRESSLIDSILESTDIFQGTILEPSCGSGLFLVSIVKKIVEERKKHESAAAVIQYILDNVYGNDIDPIALQICEINLLATLAPVIALAVKEDDSFSMHKFHLSCWDFSQKENQLGKFDLIIGNPPFVTMYGKRSRNMTEEKRAYYNTFDFVQNKKGNNKFNIAMFFVENGLQHLKDRGHIVYILDIAFFETAYIDLRKYIIQGYSISSIKKGIQAFEGVASGQIVIDIQNTQQPNEEVLFIDYENDQEVKVNQSLWDNAEMKYKIYMPLDATAQTINDKVKAFPKLDYFFPGKALRTCCALTGRTEDFIVNHGDDAKCPVYPYLEGSKGLKEKFGHICTTRLIKYDYQLQLDISNEFKQELSEKGVKNKKRVTLGDKDAYESPKLFIRQSAPEIIATYTEDSIAANNSIYVLTNKKSNQREKELLKYVCGLLNSDLITYFCRANKIIRYEKGKTPQIKTSDLKDICINICEKEFPQIVKTVDMLLDNPSDKKSLEMLNDMVYKIYKIDSDERKYISDYLAENN